MIAHPCRARTGKDEFRPDRYWPGQGDLPDGAAPTGDGVRLAPDRGTALVFGGDLTHAGLPVAEGLRSVLVASFSTRTPASPPDRVNGLQPGATSGSLREASY